MSWGRIIAGAILLELALIVVFVPLLAIYDIATLGPYVAAGCVVFGFAFGWWTVRKVRSRRLLHATLVGVVATLIYLGLCATQPGGIATVAAAYGTTLFVLGNGLRILGAAAGGLVHRP